MEQASMILDLLEQVRKEERNRARRLVRKNCAACLGNGIGGWSESPGPDGEPVPAECEYCGPAIHAIMED